VALSANSLLRAEKPAAIINPPIKAKAQPIAMPISGFLKLGLSRERRLTIAKKSPAKVKGIPAIRRHPLAGLLGLLGMTVAAL
jgi:hypothetical protein